MTSFVCITKQVDRHTSGGDTFFGFWSTSLSPIHGFCLKKVVGQPIIRMWSFAWNLQSCWKEISRPESTVRVNHHRTFDCCKSTDIIWCELRAEAKFVAPALRKVTQQTGVTRNAPALNVTYARLDFAEDHVFVSSRLPFRCSCQVQCIQVI